MTDLFSTILKLGLAGSYAIVLVMIFRILLRKSPKIFSYLLWSIVFFRLICPVSFTTNFSIVPESITYPEQFQTSETTPSYTEELPEESVIVDDQFIFEYPAATVTVQQKSVDWMEVFCAIWILGVLLLLSYSVTSLITLKRKLSSSRQIQKDVFENDLITTPFVLGFLHPHIYLPVHVQDEELDYILMHERVHILRKDHLVKPAAFMITCLHWFNPLVWIAWFSMSRDMEMSCDEAVIQKLGTSIKKEYSTSLLNMASRKNILNASPLAFSDHNAKNRILNVLNYKKPAFWMMAIAAVLITSLSLGLTTNKYKSPELENTLNLLAPYLNVEPDSVEVLSKTAESETVIYKLAQGDSSNPKNCFFLIFKNGVLSDVYFNLPEDEEIEKKFYTANTAIDLAKQYVLDIYQEAVEVDEQTNYYNVLNYGDPRLDYGIYIELKCIGETQTFYITVSPVTGRIISSTTSDDNDIPYLHYSNGDHSITLYRGWAVHSVHNIISEIYISEIKNDYFSFDQQIIQISDDSFMWTVDNEEIKLYKDNHNNYSDTIDAADINNQWSFKSHFNDLLLEYSKTKDKTKVLEMFENTFSTRSKVLHEKQELNWTDSFEQILGWIDNLLETHDEITLTFGGYSNSTKTNWWASTTTSATGSTYTTPCTWTTLMVVIEEQQTIDGKEYRSFKVDEFYLLPPEEYWETETFLTPQEAAQHFYDALNQRNFTKIFTMMPYREDYRTLWFDLMKYEINPTHIESIDFYKNTALATICFDEIIPTTDSDGTTFSYTNHRIYYLKLIQTDDGWMMSDFTTQRTYTNWIDKE